MKTILVVDDEEQIRKIYGKVLTQAGFNVLEAASAVVANEVLKNKSVDLILLDINMSGVDGTILGEIAQAFYRKTKIIVSSVYPLEDQKNLIKEATDYYDKSESMKILVHKVKEALHESLKDKKILIIDDDPQIVDLFSRLLHNAGYSPVAFRNPQEALTYSKEYRRDIALVVLDLELPGIDGMDFFEAIKEEQPQIKVIVASVYPIDKQKTCIFDADDYYDKADTNTVFLDKIEKLLQEYIVK